MAQRLVTTVIQEVLYSLYAIIGLVSSGVTLVEEIVGAFCSVGA